MYTTDALQRLKSRLAPFASMLVLIACGANTEPDVDSTQQTLLGDDSFIYLRCNATGWGVDDSTRLQSTTDPNVFTLTFTVDQSWMTANSGDQCTLTETNQLNGWGTWQQAFTKADSNSLQVPGSGPIEPAWQYFNVLYPELGEYTATLDWSTSTISIESNSGTQPLVLDWPLPGQQGTDWVINNYVDLDPSYGVLDYHGGSRTYDGHTGTDWDVSTFRQMDANVPVLASAPGEVISFEQSNPDRHTQCSGDWNYVTVQADNGYQITYGHLKQNSVVVSLGQQVQAGDPLAVVGSSGCSTQPHVHVEILDPPSRIVDPFVEGLWRNPPPYETPLTIMDIVVSDQYMSSVEDIVDPVDNVSVFTWGPMGVGLSVAGAVPGDVLDVTVLQPDGTVYYDGVQDITEDYPHSFWYQNISLNALQGPEGTYTLEVRANGDLQRTYQFEVVSP